ncbi:MAG: hypothetical protein IJE97_17465 [Thermoguttaceae bacterium]|nr:hypothetical protein [Thermoguttaceae bacterium]MBQ7110852.1 hypothetical protein [Thermoguttaceae bacterium]
MNGRVRFFEALLALGSVAAFGGWASADESCFWGAPGARTTYSPPYDPSDAPTIPLLKRSETATGGGSGSDAAKKNAEASVGPRVGDSGTFVGTDGKTYYYRFVEGVRRRAVVETRPDASSPSGWRKVLRYVDEPRLIKQIWPAEVASAPPEPCRPVGNVVEISENVGVLGTANASSGASENEPTILYRATVRVVVP